MLMGIIAKPTASQRFVVRAYIPESWHGYYNQITLTLDDQRYPIEQPIQTGFNEILVSLLESRWVEEDYVFFQLEAESVCSPNDYDVHSEDGRKVSMLLIELGFI